MEKVFASIITIGDELLIGQVIDTNSAWIAQELNKAGILVKNRVSVGDVREDIWNALETERKKASIVLITGGLGPTADDITKPLLCEYFGGKMIMDEATLAHVTDIFERILKRPMIERNRKQRWQIDAIQYGGILYMNGLNTFLIRLRSYTRLLSGPVG